MPKSTLATLLGVSITLCLTCLVTVSVAEEATDLEDRIIELRKAADFDSALALSRRLEAERRADSLATRHEVADAKRLVQTLERIVAMPSEERSELAAAASLEDSIDALWDAGRYYDGALLAQHMLEVQRRLLGSRAADVSATLSYLGSLQKRSGNPGDAEASFREALDIDRSVLGDDHPDIAIDLGNLAGVLADLGDFDEAEELFRDALRRNRELYGDDDLDVATTLNNYASMLKKRGYLSTAETLLREALRIRREKLGATSWGTANVLNNLANLFDLQGSPDRAEPILREALEIYRGIDPDHRNVGIALNNMGLLHSKRGNAARAEELYREALGVYERSVGESHRLYATCLSNLALALESRGELVDAESYHRRALATRRATFGATHPMVAVSLNNLAHNLLRQRRLEESASLFLDAIDMKRRALGRSHVSLLKSLVGLARVHLERGQHENARARLTEATRVYESARLRAGTGLSRVTFQDSPYPLLAVALLAANEPSAAWEAAERDRARALSEFLEVNRARELTEDERAELARRGKQLSAMESQVELYARLAATDTAATVRHDLERARMEFFAAEKSWNDFLVETDRRHAPLRGSQPGIAELQRVLGSEDAVMGWLDVEINLGHSVSWVWVVRDKGPVQWTQLPGDPAEMSYRPLLFRDALTRPGGLHLGVAKLARQIWDDRIQPALPALEGAQRLIVISSGAMLGIPVEALTDEYGALAAERWRIRYAPSAAMLASRVSYGPLSQESSSLLIGAPHFGERSGYAPLPGARDEIRAVAELAPQAVVLLGVEASEANVDSLVTAGALDDFAVVHFASHATVNDVRPGQSAIVLSQVDLPDNLEAAASGGRVYDGLVTSDEIAREWNLRANVVTLSACETALGREVAGEGYVGLAHALLGAGAGGVVVSLWKVDDVATELLMRRMYQSLFGGTGGGAESVADALSEAKESLRTYVDATGARPFAHPFYWSSFILVGR